MTKNTKTLLCSILAIILIAGTMVGVFAEATASKTSAIVDVTAVTDVETTVKTDEANSEEASETTTTIAEPDESTTESTEPDVNDYLLGDVDLNGKIEAKDARLALRYSARLENLSAIQVRIADVIVDGTVYARDARLILRRSANLVPQSALGLAPAETSSTAA